MAEIPVRKRKFVAMIGDGTESRNLPEANRSLRLIAAKIFC